MMLTIGLNYKEMYLDWKHDGEDAVCCTVLFTIKDRKWPPGW